MNNGIFKGVNIFVFLFFQRQQDSTNPSCQHHQSHGHFINMKEKI